MDTDAHGFEENDLTGAVIGSAFEVSKGLGAGFLETVYERALIRELALRGCRQSSRPGNARREGILYDFPGRDSPVESPGISWTKAIRVHPWPSVAHFWVPFVRVLPGGKTNGMGHGWTRMHTD